MSSPEHMNAEPARIMTESQQTMDNQIRTVMRIIVNDNTIKKVTLQEKPQTLVEQLEEKLGLQYKFSLQYEDPSYDNKLFDLDDIADLPDRPTLKIIALVPTPTSSTAERPTPSTADSGSVSVSSSAHQSSLIQSPWPDTFEIPLFLPDIEHRLNQGNIQYLRDKTCLKVTRDMRHWILEGLAQVIYKFSEPYPRGDQWGDVATALIKKHPCLTERGSINGCKGWISSITFKMRNLRKKLRRAGCANVALDERKRKAKEAPRSCVKKAKRFETNYLPNYPAGEDETSMESKQKELVEEMKKRRPSAVLISKIMDSTYALRRKELVHNEPTVKDTIERWPALFTEAQIGAEFCRLTTKNLKSEFFQELDKHTSRFLEIFKSKGGRCAPQLQEYLRQVSPESTDATGRRTAVLRGLPVFLGDDDTEFFKTCFDTDDLPDMSHLSIGILIVVPEDSPASPHSLHLDSSLSCIVLEGTTVIDDLQSLPHAICLLFGLIYALNLEYPKPMKNTFDFIQRVLLSLGHKSLKPKIQSLKNRLME